MSYKNAVNNDSQELLTIFVETLTGTTFEVKVSPRDRVKSIKSKIQKVEGIPVSHQHLLFKSKELHDSSCITEPSVALHDRATIKLVLSMRGGPISLVHQAVPFNRTILKNLVKLNREDLLEDLPSGCKMAILVLRVGDQINLLHVVEDVDNPCDSLLSGKDDLSFDLLESESSKTMEENSVTMEKVCDLKERMANLSLQRKSLKVDFKSEESESKTLINNVLQQSKPGSSTKLPSISQQGHGEMFKSRSDFSQVPILPDIIPQTFKNTSRDLEFVSLDEKTTSSQLCDTLRPKTCPASVTESEFYDVFSGSGCENPLQIAQPHFRSCVSACDSKVHHEWGGAKPLLQSLNILPPIATVPEVLSSRRKISNSKAQNLQTSAVPSVEKIDIHHRNLSSAFKFKQNLRKESQSSFSRSESAFLSKSDDYSEARYSDCLSTNSHYTPSNTYELFPTASLSSSTDSSYCELVNNKTKNNLVEPIQNTKKVECEKKSRPRCSECKKRLSLISTFECRCGFAFCSYHRYSETHHCTYDFKKESRKMLEQANPSAVAPKLPKI